MNIQFVNPRKCFNKAFLKQKPLQADIDLFKANLIHLLEKVDEIEREVNQRNPVLEFPSDHFYRETNEIKSKVTK